MYSESLGLWWSWCYEVWCARRCSEWLWFCLSGLQDKIRHSQHQYSSKFSGQKTILICSSWVDAFDRSILHVHATGTLTGCQPKPRVKNPKSYEQKEFWKASRASDFWRSQGQGLKTLQRATRSMPGACLEHAWSMPGACLLHKANVVVPFRTNCRDNCPTRLCKSLGPRV